MTEGSTSRRVKIWVRGGPGDHGIRQRGGNHAAVLHNLVKRTNLDDDGGHPRLPQHRKRHSPHLAWCAEREAQPCGNLLCQKSTGDRLITVARVVHDVATTGCRRETKPDVQVDLGVIGLCCLSGLVGVAEQRDSSAVASESAVQCTGNGRETTTLADPDVAPSQGVVLLAAGLCLSDGGDQGERLMAGGDPEQLIDRGTSCHPVSRELNVSLELGQRLGGGITEDAVDTTSVEAE